MWKKLERWVKRTLGKVLSTIEQIEEYWSDLPPVARGILVQYAAQALGFAPIISEQQFWRELRTRRDSELLAVRYRAQQLWQEAHP